MLFYLSMLSCDEDKEIFEKIYSECKMSMFYTAFEILKSKEKAEDAIHDSFIRIINHFEKFREYSFLQKKAYCITTCRNRAFDIKKHDNRSFSVDDNSVFDKVNDIPLMEDQIIEKMDCVIIAEKIAELPILYRDALCMRLVDGLSIKNIAELLSLSVGTATKRIQRGRIMLIDKLQKVGF